MNSLMKLRDQKLGHPGDPKEFQHFSLTEFAFIIILIAYSLLFSFILFEN